MPHLDRFVNFSPMKHFCYTFLHPMTEIADIDELRGVGPFRIRTATIDDAEGLVEYLRVILDDRMASIADLDEMMLDVHRQREHLRRMQQRSDALALVALHGDEIIGYLSLEPGRRRKIGHTVELGMSVREDWRRKGVGRELIRRAEEWASSNDRIEKISLNVFSENEAALKLYESCGFQIEGRLIRQVKIGDEYQDLILMGKFLHGFGALDGKEEWEESSEGLDID
jgi:RimJ/RimL family protein N-acetyltransferase